MSAIRALSASILGLLVALTASLAFGSLQPASATEPAAKRLDVNCSDFGSQAAAQQYFLNHGGPDSDPDGLDADGDGIACESNPCPCNYSTQPSSPPPSTGSNPGPKLSGGAKVLKVLRGDVVKVRFTGRGKAVRVLRLIGIESPSTTQCGGKPALQDARKVLPRGTSVTVSADARQRAKDGRGRLLRYVNKRSADIGRVQLTKGNAKVLSGSKFKRSAKYRTAQRKARNREAGLWGTCS